MKRRTFIKGIALSIPSLWLKPDALLPITRAVFPEKLSDHDSRQNIGSASDSIPGSSLSLKDSPFIVFIGDFGIQVLDRFRPMLKAFPVLRPCYHIHQEINFIDRFVNLSAPVTAMGSLYSPIARINPLILVFSTNRDEDTQIAKTLAVACRACSPVHIFTITGGNPSNGNVDVFDLEVTDPLHQPLRTAELLHSIHNSYCGCSGIGNLVCLKIGLCDLVNSGFKSGRLLSQVVVNGNATDIASTMKSHLKYQFSDGSLFGSSMNTRLVILDLPSFPKNPYIGFDIIHEIFDEDESVYYNHVNPSAPNADYRLTLIEFMPPGVAQGEGSGPAFYSEG